jgi:hypothetical protein
MGSNVFIENKIAWLLTIIACSSFFAPVPGAADENSQLILGNGLEIRLFTPEDVMAMTVRDEAGRLILRLAGGTEYQLIENILDPQIANKGDGSFHPMDPGLVIEALARVDARGERIAMDTEVYVLPLPRSGILASSACNNRIFLSPGVVEIDPSLVARTAAHELGHVFQCRFAPRESGTAWQEYLALRGIDDGAVYAEDAPRAFRPTEIFAEDFRYLFGGDEARSADGIENSELPLPDAVPGLEEYFLALLAPAKVADAPRPEAGPLALSNYPNPFNPSTTIRVVFGGRPPASPREVGVTIHRADGSLVRRVDGGAVSGSEFSARWDGRDDRGNPAPSGVYFYAVRFGEAFASGKMLLVR